MYLLPASGGAGTVSIGAQLEVTGQLGSVRSADSVNQLKQSYTLSRQLSMQAACATKQHEKP
jgi:hypothetical protein